MVWPFTKKENISNEYLAFITHVRAFGMPVRLLLVAKGSTDIYLVPSLSLSETVDYEWTYGEIDFTAKVAQYILDLTKVDPIGDNLNEQNAIRDIYHESTHAYFNINSDDPKVATIIRDGTAYYKDALMKDGSTALDPVCLFKEAAAMYVGYRVAIWYDFLGLLQVVDRDATEDNIVVKIADARRWYNSSALKLDFGYEWRDGAQLYTIKRISDELKRFCDHDLLEDKIPDDFDHVPAYQELVFNMITRRCP
jgi:hypothetical protein